jgi:hypothetical protein
MYFDWREIRDVKSGIMSTHARPASRLLITSLVVLGLLACSSIPAAQPTEVGPLTNILFLGNSLTLHGPSPEIGWTANWGMAASDSTKDFAHVLSARFPGARHRQVNLGAFESAYRTFDVTSVDSLLVSHPDLVVVELGDNVSDDSDFESYYRKLLDHIELQTDGTVLCTNTWFGKSSIDAAVRRACTGSRRRFVDLSSISANVLNRAGSERHFSDSGVAGHPGDRGMAAVAAALYDALGR